VFRAEFDRWLRQPPVTGWLALPCALIAISVPTAIRLAVSGVVTGCEFTPYLPFILVCAILLRWWQAGAAALMSVAIMGGEFGGSSHFGLECFVSAAAIFLAASAAMILFVTWVRSASATRQRQDLDESMGGVVFSLEKGEVWASWYGQGTPVRLGSQRKVSEMMSDFLAQAEVGKRLNGGPG
jgi:hypothetical protein